MNLILISINPTDSRRDYTDLGKALQELGADCHTFRYTWVLRTSLDPKNVYNFLEARLLDPDDQFIVAPLSGDWLPYKCQSNDDCFRF